MMGATVSLAASTKLEDRVRAVVAFNPYDYPQGVGRANRVAAAYARLRAVGAVVTKTENEAVLGIVLRSGRREQAAKSLPGRASSGWSTRGYPRVAREVYRNVESMIAARALYARISAPVTLIHADYDWSRASEREANVSLLPGARSISLPDTGHFATLEQPDHAAGILLASVGA